MAGTSLLIHSQLQWSICGAVHVLRRIELVWRGKGMNEESFEELPFTLFQQKSIVEQIRILDVF